MLETDGITLGLQRLRRKNIIFELFILSLICVFLILTIREFVAKPFITTGDSMAPTFMSNEYLVLDEISYYFHMPERGDVVIFRYPLDPSIFFIKRLIGIPGDTVTITDGIVSIRTSSTSTPQIFAEPYVSPMNQKKETSTITLATDEYFVMGDNRSASSDSRVWGPVPRRYIVGRPVVRIYPFQHFSILPGKFLSSVISSSTSDAIHR